MVKLYLPRPPATTLRQCNKITNHTSGENRRVKNITLYRSSPSPRGDGTDGKTSVARFIGSAENGHRTIAGNRHAIYYTTYNNIVVYTIYNTIIERNAI